MKGNDKIIETLNKLLADELAAINQYIVHAEMCEDWGYGALHDAVQQRSIAEMRHAETLIGRLLYLEGRPVVSKMGAIHIGADVAAQFQNDLGSEVEAVGLYNDAIRQAVELGDNGTKMILEGILRDEEEHIDWLETQLDQIEQMGLSSYLVEQVG